MAVARLRCSPAWLRCSTPARYCAPLAPTHGFVGPLTTRYFSEVANTRDLAKKLLQHYPQEDPTDVTTRNLELFLKQLPGVDATVLQSSPEWKQLKTVAAEWKELYSAACLDDLLDMDFAEEVVLRPELRRREADQAKMFEDFAQAQSESPVQAAKQAKAARFEQFADSAKAEEEAFAKHMLEKACQEVEKEAAAKIAAINENTQKLIKEVERELETKRAAIVESLREQQRLDKDRSVVAEPRKLQLDKLASNDKPKRDRASRWAK